ncbi:HAD superfamily hydrolase (TIGR01549 family) [Actinoplanes octamycinicus]|uniref:HAD superfamily hydrolase (TIGR01549 family) n=1 Tax=Actinoplanes octamycinicus TaxID=135948 RepID=A0A7W7M9E3_9ACTN|nr:HAD family hydrolase [Actinoplanes octamycinicus]MBB4741735.1 HAD superfamily hydrolase (TIGR01549 family) [Actinoplanes octamycinicus]GIE57289.1 haloacid dehalogenase [Actinoplanes octamycinicus]
MADTAIFDVDGTLVDTNYQHAIAWYRAFRRHELTVPVWRIHRAIGMGGDQLVPAVAGDDAERRHGDALREAQTEEFDRLIDEVRPFDGARELIEEVKSRGFRVVLASSGRKQHVEHFLDLVGGRPIADAWTSADDVERSKPAPDLVATAMERAGGASGVMIGDSTWDCVAARKLDVPTLAVRTGGFSAEELTDAGAVRVFDSLIDLRKALDETALGSPS